MRDQLMAKYTTDPATEGYGIYLVLWFADPDKPISQSPDGVRPSSPDELRQWLERDLSPEKARKIPMTFGAAFDLFVDLFNGVGGGDLALVGSGESGVGGHIVLSV